MKRLVLVAAAAAAFPATAAAHGRSAPVATNWEARVEHTPSGLLARPVDGDRDLWLRAAPGAHVEVRGTLGEPLLRFDSGGVWVNTASPTALGDRIVRGAGHGWKRVASSGSYRWHEHRLHVLEAVGGGRWSVPLRVDGRAAAITGELRHVEPGSAWPWLAGATAAAAAGVLLGAARTSATVATVAAGAVRTGRALYGRPDVAWSGYLDVALTSAFVVALLVWLGAVRGTRGFVACIAGSFAFAEGVVLLPVLARAVALNALPTTASKALVAAALGAGVGAAVAGVRVLVHEDAPA